MSIRIRTKYIIDELEDRGFLRAIPDSRKKYGFIHKAWQTYFAACYFKRLKLNSLLEKIKGVIEFKRWDEVLLILTCIANKKDSKKIIEEIAKWDITIAAHCIGISGNYDIDVSNRIVKHLETIAEDIRRVLPIRGIAIESLVATKTPKALSFLIRLLEKVDHSFILVILVTVLGEMGYDESIDILKEVLRFENQHVVELAYRALRRIGSEKALQAVIDVGLEDDSFAWIYLSSPRSQLIEAIENKYGPERSDGLAERLFSVVKNNDKEEHPRLGALRLLARLTSDKRINLLKLLVHIDNKLVSKCAVEQLVSICFKKDCGLYSKKAEDVVLELLHDEDPKIREMSLRAFYDNPECFRARGATFTLLGPSIFIELLLDNYYEVRRWALIVTSDKEWTRPSTETGPT